MAKGFVQRYPVYTTGKANLSALASGLAAPAARWPTTCSSRPTPMPECWQPVPGQTYGRVRSARRRRTRRVHPERRQRRPRAAAPGRRQPGHGQLRRLARQAQRRRRIRRGHRRWLRPRRRQRVAGVPAVRAGPGPHPGDGQLRREHRRRQGHLRVVPAAAPHAGPAAGDRRRGRRDLVLRRRARVPLRAVAQAAVGCAPAGRQLPGAERGPADRRVRPVRVAQSAVPAVDGRRRRPTWRASSPTTPTCPPNSGSASPRRGCRCCRPHSSSWARRPRC